MAARRRFSSSARRRSTGTSSAPRCRGAPSSTANCSTSTGSRPTPSWTTTSSTSTQTGHAAVARAVEERVRRAARVKRAATRSERPSPPFRHRRRRAGCASTRSRATCRTSPPTTSLDAGFDADEHVWVVRRTELDVAQPFASDDARRARRRGAAASQDRRRRVATIAGGRPRWPRSRPRASGSTSTTTCSRSVSTSASSRSTERRPTGRRASTRFTLAPPDGCGACDAVVVAPRPTSTALGT